MKCSPPTDSTLQPWCSCSVWSVAGALLPHLQQLSSVQFPVMCENKLICFFTSCSDVCIVRQLLKHSESNIVSEQCQWPGTGLGSSLHVNPARSRSADRCIWQWGEKRITRMSQLHLDYAGELSVCNKSGLIKQEICLRASSLLSASVLYICCSCSHLPRRHLGRAASCLFRWYQRPAAMSSSCNHTFHHVRDGWTDLP